MHDYLFDFVLLKAEELCLLDAEEATYLREEVVEDLCVLLYKTGEAFD